MHLMRHPVFGVVTHRVVAAVLSPFARIPLVGAIVRYVLSMLRYVAGRYAPTSGSA